MKLTDSSLLQMLLGTCNVVTGRQVSHDLFTNPAALENSGLGVGKAPLQVGDDAIVCGLTAQVVWVGNIDRVVSSS